MSWLKMSLFWNRYKESVFKSSTTSPTEKWFGIKAWTIIGNGLGKPAKTYWN